MPLHKILEQYDVTISAAEFESLCQCIKNLDTITSKAFYECCTKYSVDAQNPALPLIAVGLLCEHNNPHIIPILKEVINNHLFHKAKRTPFLELKFWLFFDARIFIWLFFRYAMSVMISRSLLKILSWLLFFKALICEAIGLVHSSIIPIFPV